jgi:hypothetical protein
MKRIDSSVQIMLMATLALSGCSSKPWALRKRPNGPLATIFHSEGVEVHSVDSHRVSGHKLYILPGCRIIHVGFTRAFQYDKTEQEQYVESIRTPFAANAAARKRLDDNRRYETDAGVVDRSASPWRIGYETRTTFAVELRDRHEYEIVATFDGDEFVPRLIEYDPNGVRTFAYSAASGSARDCTASKRERREAEIGEHSSL